MKVRPARILLSMLTALTMLMTSAWVMADFAQSPEPAPRTAAASTTP